MVDARNTTETEGERASGRELSCVEVEAPLLGRQRLAYRTAGVAGGGDAPTVVLVHPNSCSSESWERQLSDTATHGGPSPLAPLRRVAIDLPGHGHSVRVGAGTNAYSVPFYAAALAAFADALGLQGAVWVGHSLGGHAVVEALALLPSPAGALIYGSPPVESAASLGGAFFPMPGGPHFLTAELAPRDVHHWQASVFYSALPAWFEENVGRTDPLARSGLLASLATIADEVAMVRAAPCPVAIAHGEFERCVRRSYLDQLVLGEKLWRGGVQIVAESNHFTQYDNPDDFNALLAAFVADVAPRNG